MKTGLAIITYVPSEEPEGIRRRLPAALESLSSSGYAGRVSIIDDGSTDPAHLEFLASLPPAISVVRRQSRGGIARAKNTALRVLREAEVDLGFLAEDDIAFFPHWCDAYVEAHKATGIHHFSWAWDEDPSGEMRKEERLIRDFPVVDTSRVNGVFLTFTPTVLEVVGGFKILPALWGHEHTHWTRRIVTAGLAPFFADLAHSHRYLGLNPNAHYSAIAAADRARFADQNEPLAEVLDPLFEPLAE
jgi:glycosyltransferase involved in cell wall biosynthesis